MGTLVVVRHAKAEREAETDAARPLAARGVHDARSLGEWLGPTLTAPTQVHVSTAVRARQTWDAVTVALSVAPASVEVDPALYSADEDAVLDLVRLCGPEAVTVVVVAHNPTMADLVDLLHDGSRTDAWRALGSRGFPTCATAVLDVPGPWSGIGRGAAVLRTLWTPAGGPA